MDPVTVTSAVAASDPRVTEVMTVKVGQSGFARSMRLVVALSGDEPVSTDTVVNIAAAALQHATSEIDELVLFARDADDTSQLLDLSAAAEGLPEGVHYRWINSSLQIIGADPADLTAG